MHKKKRIAYIENFLSKLLTSAGISDNIFVGTLPTTTDSEWEDMVCVEVQRMTDRAAYSEGSVLVYLYARPTGTPSRKNVARLNEMERALSEAIEGTRDGYYSCYEQWRDSDYDNDRMFHYNVISLHMNVRDAKIS